MKIFTTCLNICMLCFQMYSNANIDLSLDEYLTKRGVSKEQNAGHTHIQPGIDNKADLFSKILENNPNVRTVVEIGLCLGHSAEIFLTARPDITVLSFDMMYHWFNDAGKDYIDLKHPGKHRLIRGDSLVTVPTFIKNNQNRSIDLIFVDVGHEYHVALQDILNMKQLARPNTVLVVDDTNYKPVNDAWEKCIADGIVEELERDTENAMGFVVGRYIF